jgi:hypothetical protein
MAISTLRLQAIVLRYIQALASKSSGPKAIAGAFMESYSQMVIAVLNCKAQSSGNKTGSGAGCALKVDE